MCATGRESINHSRADTAKSTNAPSFLQRALRYRTVGIRECIVQQGGGWLDTVLIERRADTVGRSNC